MRKSFKDMGSFYGELFSDRGVAGKGEDDQKIFGEEV